MSIALLIEQLLNGLQLGVMLFLMAAGLTLIFGVMGLINLAHGSLYMVGAFACAAVAAATGSFWIGLAASLVAAAAAGAIMEVTVIRRLYERDHLDQVLATFALILIFSEGTRWLFGSFPLYLDIPPLLQGAVPLPGGGQYQLYRLAIIGVGIAGRRRPLFPDFQHAARHAHSGGRIRPRDDRRARRRHPHALHGRLRAGRSTCRPCRRAGRRLQSVQVGMGEPALILAFVVIVIGGIGSIKGALLGAMLVGVVDTMGRFLLPKTLALMMPAAQAGMIGARACLDADLHRHGA